MWHIFPHGGHMEIESLRLDFQTLIITKPQNNSRAYQRRKKKKKKKKKPEEPRQRARLGLRVAWVASGFSKKKKKEHACNKKELPKKRKEKKRKTKQHCNTRSTASKQFARSKYQ